MICGTGMEKLASVLYHWEMWLRAVVSGSNTTWSAGRIRAPENNGKCNNEIIKCVR